LTNQLDDLVEFTKNVMLNNLRSQGTTNGQILQQQVLSVINTKETRDGEIKHETKPIHLLAFVLAYKQLEQGQQIIISRPSDIPFPMTDYRTTFTLSP